MANDKIDQLKAQHQLTEPQVKVLKALQDRKATSARKAVSLGALMVDTWLKKWEVLESLERLMGLKLVSQGANRLYYTTAL